MNWYREFDRRQRNAFWACFGGWALDAMDVQMYALVLPTLLAEWSLTKAQGGTLGTATLMASSLGGVAAGYLADRVGRVKILQVCVLWFSLFTFLSGLAQNFEQLFFCRVMQGVGFGGEWAAGAVLMAEIISANNRGKVLAAVSSGWAVGYGTAAILFAVMFNIFPATTAWRVMFLLGILPSFLTIFVQRHVHEPEMFTAAKATASQPAGIGEIFGGGLARTTVTAWAICLGVLGGNYTILLWLPTFLAERHLSASSATGYLLVNILGSFLGYVIGGVVSDALGRRNALRLFAVVGTLSVVSYLAFAASPLAILVMGFPLGFAQSAMNSGIAPLLSELFPTRLRATGQGFCYNAGRGVGAVFPALVGWYSKSAGLALAISVAAASTYALVLICTFLLPETSKRDLSAVGATEAGN